MYCFKLFIVGIVILGFGASTWGLGLSSQLAFSVCRQREKFSTSQTIQPAQKKAPKEKVTCGRFQSSKCSPDKTLRCDEAPSFKFMGCDKTGRSALAALRLLGSISEPKLFITFKKSSSEVTQEILQKLTSEKSVNRETQRLSTIKALRDFSFKQQKDVIDFIKASPRGDSIKLTSLWLTNQILLEGADLELTKKLMENFSQEIAEISQDKTFTYVKPKAHAEALSQLSEDADTGERKYEDVPIWAVEAMEVDKVWAEGNRGEGVIVGLIDSGARATHNFLKSNFIGIEKGWYDPTRGEEVPNDTVGHGTFTTGIIMATEKKIGVAPGGRWMHCVGCDFKSCMKSNIVKCFQWMLCPSSKPDPSIDDQEAGEGDGDGGKCEGAPHVISNSWTTDKGIDEDINNALKATAAAGVLLVFATGNLGNDCSSVLSPNELDVVITVGALNKNGSIPYFSGRGPFTGTNIIKPDLVAPGENIVSTDIDSDDAINVGTSASFSTPHVSGVVALLLHEKPDITLEQVKECLYKTAVPLEMGAAGGQECGGVKEMEIPNNVWGHGLINAYKAIQYIKEHFKS